MKSIFTLLLLCFLFSHKLAAQNDTLFVDSNTVNYTAKEIFDSCYKNLNLSVLSTGLLIDKAIPTLNISLFTGNTDDTAVADMWQWRRAYGTLRRANIDTTVLLNYPKG